MHVERLQRMVKLLRDDAANPTGVKFDLVTWAEDASDDASASGNWNVPTAGNGPNSWSEPEAIKVPVSCGTKACAFGLAAISGEFAKEGLTYRFSPMYNGAHGSWMIPSIKVGSDYLDGMQAAAELFDITGDDAQYFFDPYCYDETPQEAEGELIVAKRIEDFINGSIDHDQHPGWKQDDEEDSDY